MADCSLYDWLISVPPGHEPEASPFLLDMWLTDRCSFRTYAWRISVPIVHFTDLSLFLLFILLNDLCSFCAYCWLISVPLCILLTYLCSSRHMLDGSQFLLAWVNPKGKADYFLWSLLLFLLSRTYGWWVRPCATLSPSLSWPSPTLPSSPYSPSLSRGRHHLKVQCHKILILLHKARQKFQNYINLLRSNPHINDYLIAHLRHLVATLRCQQHRWLRDLLVSTWLTEIDTIENLTKILAVKCAIIQMLYHSLTDKRYVSRDTRCGKTSFRCPFKRDLWPVP